MTIPDPLPVPRRSGPPIALRKSKPSETSPTADETWRSEVASICRSANPEFYDLLDLAKKPLPSLKRAEEILAAADLDESIEPLVAAGLVERPESKATTTVRFMFSDAPSLAASAGGYPIWRVMNDSFRLVEPVTAAADAPGRGDQPRRRRRTAGTGWRSSGRIRSLEGE